MRTATTEKKPREFTQAAFAVTIEEAAHMVGVSRAQFYRLYLDTKRVRAIRTGGKSRVIDVQELHEAYMELKADLRTEEESKQ